MTLLIQDAIVTAVALGAVGLVVRRVVGVVRPPAENPACGSCSSCPAPRTPRDDSRPVPIAFVR
jgi:hypothetical protein